MVVAGTYIECVLITLFGISLAPLRSKSSTVSE